MFRFACPRLMWEQIKLHATCLTHHFMQLTELVTLWFCPKTIQVVELLLLPSQAPLINKGTVTVGAFSAVLGECDSVAACLCLFEMIHALLLLFICVVLHLPLTVSFLQTSWDGNNSLWNFITCCLLKMGESASGWEFLSARTLHFTNVQQMGFSEQVSAQSRTFYDYLMTLCSQDSDEDVDSSSSLTCHRSRSCRCVINCLCLICSHQTAVRC